jgi:hypothetical protein
MRPRISLLVAFAVLAAFAPTPGGALPPHPMRGKPPISHPKDSSPLPVFQAVGLAGDLVVMDPSALLSAATSAQTDAAFQNDILTGMARNPTTGTIFLVGNDGSDSHLGVVDFTSGAVHTLGAISGEVVVDLAFGGGVLFALTDNLQGTLLAALEK